MKLLAWLWELLRWYNILKWAAHTHKKKSKWYVPNMERHAIEGSPTNGSHSSKWCTAVHVSSCATDHLCTPQSLALCYQQGKLKLHCCSVHENGRIWWHRTGIVLQGPRHLKSVHGSCSSICHDGSFPTKTTDKDSSPPASLKLLQLKLLGCWSWIEQKKLAFAKYSLSAILAFYCLLGTAGQ